MTPAQQAEVAVTVAARAVGDVTSALAAVHAAEEANEPSQWQTARERVDKAVAFAKKQIAGAETKGDKADASAKTRMAGAKEALVGHERSIAQLDAPPTGWTRGVHDDGIHSALAAPVVGAVGPSFAQKESAVRGELAKLTPEQSGVLARRLRTGLARLESYQRESRSADSATRAHAERFKPSDPIVEQFALLTPDRRERLLKFLADAKHRYDLDRARAPNANAPSPPRAPGPDSGDQSPSAIAARGVAGSGGSLPHATAIQASFGKHDVSPIHAHVGGAAADASADLGAEAYATGDSVAFAGPPDLHTAAHEAAHVIQQRAGVQLKGGIDGGSADAHEQHADAVADAVVRGESAEPVLDAMPRGAGSDAAVQRKPGAQAAPAVHDDGPPTVKAPHAKWPVFAETGLPYKIVSAQDPVQFWTVSDWIRGGAGFKAHGNHAMSPACAAEIFTALGWVPKDRIEFAAKHTVFDISRRVAESQVMASAFYYLGMPTGKPVVSRASRDIVQVATRLDDPNVAAGTRIEPDDAQRLQVIRALADFTGLAPDAGALDSLRNDPRFHDAVVQSGAVLWNIDKEVGNGIFGYDPTSDNAGPYTRWLHGKQDKKQPNADAPDKPKFKLHDYYGEPIPGALSADRDLVEAGHPIWLEVAVKWPKEYPSAADYDVVPMVTPGHLGGELSLLSCEWHIELVGAAATPTASAGSAPSATNPQKPPASPAGGAATGSNGSASVVSAAAPSASAASSGAVAHTNVGELHHAFVLPPGQAAGAFRVTVRASFEEYFEPAEFTKTVEVKSTDAAMKQLGDAAFVDLGAHQTSRTSESFDASGSGDDNHGYRTTGALPASFKPSTLDGPDPRAAAREAERKRLEASRMYLEANGGSADVLAAVDRELAKSRATETALAGDRSKGWQPFQIRGTYLSREDSVPSGPLTLYGSVHSEIVPGLAVHGVQQVPDRETVAVQVRDLSRRFDNEDMTFTGRGDTFDAALKSAFLDAAKAYPKGVMAIEAEAIDARVDGGQAKLGKGNGKSIGFELGTDSRWKRVKSEVWSPVVNIATNLGAMALMAFVPGSAVVVAPLLIAYNSAPAIDRLRTESARGTLTLGDAATSVGQIALNLLPLVGRAEAFTTEWFVIEGANWGGQAVLMTASAIQTARALQSQDVEALAGMYEELQKLESSGADPATIEQKRQQVIARAKAVSDRIEGALTEQIATNAMFAVAGTVIHNAGSAHQRSMLIDEYRKARSGAGDDSATNAGELDRTSSDKGNGSTATKGEIENPQHWAAGSKPKDRTSSDAPAGGATTQTPSDPAAHADGARSSVLDGPTLAAQVPGTTYEQGGVFRIKAAHAEFEVVIRRTNGAARIVRNGDHVVIELPRSLVGHQLERVVVDELREASALVEREGRDAASSVDQPTSKTGAPTKDAAPPSGSATTEPANPTERAAADRTHVAPTVPKATSTQIDALVIQEETKSGSALTSAERAEITQLALQRGVGPARDAFEKWRALRDQGMPTSTEQMAVTRDPHAQIEIHSHFMGNVPPEGFVEQLAASGEKRRPGELSDYEPLLRRIVDLAKRTDSKTGDPEFAHKYKPSEKDPATGKQVIEQRGVSGDALEQARIARDQILGLEREFANPKTTVARGAEIRRQVDEKAKSAVDKALRASDETDFNSSYEIRDELVKQSYGVAERGQMLVAAGLPKETDPNNIVATEGAYRKHFEGRPRVQRMIDEAVAAQRQLDTLMARTEPLSEQLRAQTLPALKKKIKAVSEQMAYDAYAMDTLRRLAEDNIRYTEQSNSASKLDQRFDPEQLEWLKTKLAMQLIADGSTGLAQKVKDLGVKQMTMINTGEFGTDDPNVDTRDLKRRGRPDQKTFEKDVKQVVDQTERKDVVGVDIAGMEHLQFDKIGKDRFRYLYDEILKAAIKRGEPIVLRPHVGEGAADVVPGEHGMRDMNRQVKRGELTHYARARENLDGLISVLEGVAAEHGGKLPPQVIVRFGHATHTTPQQAERIARLGIIPEVNLQSNVETGALSQSEHNIKGGDARRTADFEAANHEADPTKRDAKLADHSLATLIFNNAQIVLSTDAHEVMSTHLGNEYAQALKIIEAVQANKIPVEITGKQASREISNGGSVEDPGHRKVVEIFYSEMSPEKRAVFDGAYQKLFDDAHKYFDERPKAGNPGSDGSSKAAEGGIQGTQTDDPGNAAPVDDKRSHTSGPRDQQPKSPSDLAQ